MTAVKAQQYAPPILSTPVEFKYDMTKPTTFLGKIRLTISSLTLGSGEKKQSAEEKLAEDTALAAAMSQPSIVPDGVAPSPILAALPPGVAPAGSSQPPVTAINEPLINVDYSQHVSPGVSMPPVNTTVPIIPAVNFDLKVCSLFI